MLAEGFAVRWGRSVVRHKRSLAGQRRSQLLTVMRVLHVLPTLALPSSDDCDMDSPLELQRQTHEEIERYERALATVLSKPATSQQTKLSNEHTASKILDDIASRTKTLDGLYKDEEGRRREVELLSGSKADDLSEFYTRLGRIKEHHLKYPDQPVGGFELELTALVDADPEDYDEENEEEDRECHG